MSVIMEVIDFVDTPHLVLVQRCVECGAVLVRRELDASTMTPEQIEPMAMADGLTAMQHDCPKAPR